VRVLVATVPALGHINPLVPLARGLRDAGHDLVWATSAPMQDRLQAEGFATRQAGPPFDEWRAMLAHRTRGRPGDGIRAERTREWFVPRLFGEVGAALLVDELLALARELEPDVVLFDSRCYAAPAVARSVGALPVLRAVTTLQTPASEELVSEAVSPLWCELGLGPPVHAGVLDGLTFSGFPAALDDPSPYPGLEVHRLRPEAATEREPDWLPPWLHRQDGRPLVYATLGTVFGGDGTVLTEMLEALTALDVAVLLTLGSAGDPTAFPRLPDRVRVERYVPQDSVLPHCSVVVSHGGSGTLLGALANGVPQVAIPQGADQFHNAASVERHGFGRRLLPPAAGAEAIGLAVSDVLADDRYRRSAERLGAAMRSGISIGEAVGLIEAAA
jgi:UDP:flavonoid glycosyltransferase YjiC (YdhE family)